MTSLSDLRSLFSRYFYEFSSADVSSRSSPPRVAVSEKRPLYKRLELFLPFIFDEPLIAAPKSPAANGASSPSQSAIHF